jgi:hypothetical protein
LGALEPFEIHVLEIAGGSVAAIHAFLDPALFPVFGLPSTPEPVTDWAILHAVGLVRLACTCGDERQLLILPSPKPRRRKSLATGNPSTSTSTASSTTGWASI